MQNKYQNPTPGNMTGIYLGMRGSPPRFNHLAAIPPLFRRLSYCRAKTSVEHQRFRKIEMLRVIEPAQGFKGAAVKAKVKCVNPEVELLHQRRSRSTVLTAEELSKLASKVLKDFGSPRANNSVNLSRGNVSSRLQSGRGKLPKSTRQPSIQELSVVTSCGRSNDHCRTTLPKQEYTEIKPWRKEISESVKLCQSVRRNPTWPRRSNKAQHLALKCLQSSQLFTRTDQANRTARICSQNPIEDKLLLPSSFISGSPFLLPRVSSSLGKVHLAGQWGYKMPRLNTALGNDLVSRTLELKQRTDGNDPSKAVMMAAPVNGHRMANGMGRLDGVKGKCSHSTVVCSAFNSGASTTPHTDGNGPCTDRRNSEPTDSRKNKVAEGLENDNPGHVEAEESDSARLEDPEVAGAADEKEDEESLAADSTEHLAKQIEVIINLRVNVDEDSETDLQVHSDQALE
ncbi:uncharacterized protein LOC129695067 isoform X2 [Leucoraja erinacea]|uniref:uncharacterized protein LOC129695067 isoform X2 n=1 Tax=Leucoraja erinaceus TaxID=7782 RepID=UPI002455924E|nr:uncharacterized protein LOC129695067 isoform X2 [Leucoraja erinacea]